MIRNGPRLGYNARMSAWHEAPVAFVDLETTGCTPGASRIIEIGLVAADRGRLEYEWSSLVNPGTPISPAIQHFTGISAEMVRDAPFFEDLAEQVLERLCGRLLVAHNARFDYGFLKQELRRCGRKLDARVLCTVKLSRRLEPQAREHNLDAVIARYGLNCARRHRALPDAQALWELWAALPAAHGLGEFERAVDEIVGARAVPEHLPPQLAEELPERPGVYRFFGEGDALLYVGKATNIRERVFSHWHAALRDARAQRLAAQTRRVDWTVTAGELGALLTEARFVRELKPLHNRRLRGARAAWAWAVSDDGAAPQLAPLDALPLGFEPTDYFGLYCSEVAARRALEGLAREHRLCLKTLGLEQARGSCFAYQLGRCAGACVGKEPLRLHTARLKLAFAPHRLRPWPFDGPIGVREVDADGWMQLHLIDRWRHLGTLAEGDGALAERRDLLAASVARGYRTSPFDPHVYRILTRHLRHVSRRNLVRLEAARASAESGESFEP